MNEAIQLANIKDITIYTFLESVNDIEKDEKISYDLAYNMAYLKHNNNLLY
jgi:hypothetical protein